MEWCLECHRQPERFLRPKDKVFDMTWREESTSEAELQQGHQLKSDYRVRSSAILTSCSTCHR
jgi:cytochrome c553